MRSLTLSAPAKINLTLDVGPPRPDGYHEIRSLMQTISLCDTLTIQETNGAGVLLDIDGPEAAGVPSDATNLVWKAAARLQTAYGLPGLSLRLTKRIPSQAGLGGGSSDAAAVLRGLDRLFSLGLTVEDKNTFAAALGADVPFFLTGGLALAEGLGERLSPLPDLTPPWTLILVKPPVGIATGWAYGQMDSLPGRQAGTATEAWLAGRPTLGNDFEAVARSLPEIRRAEAALAELPGVDRPLLCGSGAALFRRIPDGQEEAITSELRVRRIGAAWAVRTTGRENG